MILLADSGSTKTDWCVADGAAEICRIATHGTNPFFQSADETALTAALDENGIGHGPCCVLEMF